MTDKRRGLGRGLGALIPPGPVPTGNRPVDVFFPQQGQPVSAAATAVLDREAADALERSAWTAGTGETSPNNSVSAGQGHISTGATEVAPPGSPDQARSEGSDWPADDAEALLPVPGASFAEIPVDAIEPNPRQPRQVFDSEDLDELVSSIREVGILQPIVVRPAEIPDDTVRFELIMGERRWRAAQLAGLATIPAIVRVTPDGDLLRDALLENLHRVQLNPLEEAAAYQQLLEDFACTHEELAARVARSRPQISNTIRLLRLPPAVQRRVAAGVLSAGHARALLGLTDTSAMELLAQRVVAEGLSVRATEEIVALDEGIRRTAPRRRGPGPQDGRLDELATRLSDHLDTRVRISLGQRKGRIAIEFATVEDLDRILGVLGPGAGPVESSDN